MTIADFLAIPQPLALGLLCPEDRRAIEEHAAAGGALEIRVGGYGGEGWIPSRVRPLEPMACYRIAGEPA